MIKKLGLISSCFLMVGCSALTQKPEVQQQATNQQPGVVNHMMHHSEDTKGQNHFARSRPGTGKRVVIFDPKATAWAAYDEDGNRVKTGRASGGKHYCADVGRGCKTVRGTFKVYSERGANCKSNKFPLGKGGAPMPHCMFFHKGYAIHGSYHVPDYNASHGCVRVLPSAAKWLSENFVDPGTTVIVKPY